MAKTSVQHVARNPLSVSKIRKLSKGSALYIHATGGEYDCDDCVFFVDGRRCNIHGPNDEISPDGSCGYFIQGRADTFDGKFLRLTKDETGYVDDVGGASCKKCKHFKYPSDHWTDCELVNRMSDGDDPGQIDPDACCCLWEASK